MARDREAAGDRHAERVLLARARRGELEALRGLVHRYASLVWAASAQVAPDEEAAAALFGECWESVLGSLGGAGRTPDLGGTVLRLCEGPLLAVAPEERVAGAIASARQLAAEEGVGLEVPPAALMAATDGLVEHAERLERETADRRAGRRRRLVLPIALAVGLLGGAVAAYVTTSRTPTEDFAARRLRERVIVSDLVPQFRDIVVPPFEAVDRRAPEARQYEEISLVLEELANMPKDVDAEQLARLGRRVEGLDLVDFAAGEAEKLRGANRVIMGEVCYVLEGLANL